MENDLKSELPRVAGGRESGSTIRFSVAGLALFSAFLVATSIVATHFVESGRQAVSASPSVPPVSGLRPGERSSDTAWGDLMTLDVEIQQPEEYVTFDTTENQKTHWVFTGMSEGQVKQQLEQCGLTASQIEATMARDKIISRSDATVICPETSVVLSLSPESHGKLYALLAAWPENKLMCEPYHLPGGFGEMAAKTGVPANAVELIGKLTYQRSGVELFSDPEVVLAAIPHKEERTKLMKALTYQTAVIARLRLSKDSDVEKIVSYWSAVPGVRDKDLRPLLESISRAPGGGTISLLYLLPQFARERLFTFPLPTLHGETQMDCHWTALNFLNSTPDDRLQDPGYASNFIRENFYQIGKPSKCGDLVFLLDSKEAVIHSAVFIADDIVFTKNGMNYAQPWILMRMKNLLNAYTREQTPVARYYRRKET